ncbi:hypothetical protein Tco_1165833 [Tanacetum coccineum]
MEVEVVDVKIRVVDVRSEVMADAQIREVVVRHVVKCKQNVFEDSWPLIHVSHIGVIGDKIYGGRYKVLLLEVDLDGAFGGERDYYLGGGVDVLSFWCSSLEDSRLT